jgi:hypothetical protein|nr:MAG TPA: hypothetical protein [Bacteriophage sp.]
MITKEQEEALKNLTNYVADYCKENDISVLMVSSINEECPNGIEQICSSVIQGNGKYIIGAIAGAIKANDKLGAFLTEGLLYAGKASGTITNIPMIENVNLN